jgi:PleD family two-component response regulator
MADKKIVLAVDDSATELKIYKYILGADYDLRICKSATDAFKILDTCKVDIILLDIEMPDVSGFEFLHQIKKIPALIRTPVIIVSSHNTPEFVSHATSQGASGLLSKPVDPAVLLEKIRYYLEHPQQGGIFDL